MTRVKFQLKLKNVQHLTVGTFTDIEEMLRGYAAVQVIGEPLSGHFVVSFEEEDEWAAANTYRDILSEVEGWVGHEYDAPDRPTIQAQVGGVWTEVAV